MGNVMCMSDPGEPKKHKIVVPMSSSNLQNITVEFPKEIEEDLERRKIESFKALSAAGSKKPPARTTSAPVLGADPNQDLYKKAKALDVPVIMVPKPWSEVDQILSKLKPSEVASPKPVPIAAPKPAELQSAETIDMSELMDDLDEGDEDGEKTQAEKEEAFYQLVEQVAAEDLTPRPIRSLESSLSFSTIHTVKEVEGGHAKPETVISILKSRSDVSSLMRSPAGVQSPSGGAIAPTTPKKLNVHPRLLARMDAFM